MVQMGKIKIEDLEKLKLNELKDFLKENGCVTTGEKGTLVFRAKAFLDGQKDSMKIDGKNPALLKAAELRKECAARGLSPIGTNDELLERLIGKLQTTDGSKQSNDSDSGANEDGPIFLAQRIVDLAENQDWEGIMSVLGENLNSSSDKSVLRKTYLKLSLLVHPDRLSGSSIATKAFQALVTAYEKITRPSSDLEDAPPKDNLLSRSNNGCHRTGVRCPRCHEIWGTPVQGIEPYCYNYLMTGLKTYTCSTCLFEFGCMTAEHECPFCFKSFEYSPSFYHQKIFCGNKKCGKEFGFWMFPVSANVEKQMKIELKEAIIKDIQKKENKNARLNRSLKRSNDSTFNQLEFLEKLFIRGLIDNCPRCGFFAEWDHRDKELHKDHLRQCNDKNMHDKYSQLLKKKNEIAEKNLNKLNAQEDVRSKAVFEFLGADSRDIWMLTDNSLKEKCLQLKIDSDNLDRSQMIRAISTSSKKRKAVELASDSNSIPSNYSNLPVQQLRDICASRGLKYDGMSKKALIKEIENCTDAKIDDIIYLE